MSTSRSAGRGPGRRSIIVGGLVVAIIGATSIGLALTFIDIGEDGPAPLPSRIDPLLPDLAVAPFTEVTAARGVNDGREWLRFGVTIVNIGDGDFLLRARRAHLLTEDWQVVQMIVERGGGHTELETPAGLVFGGDGHDHWHIRDVEAHRLETLDGQILSEVVKQGYCFFDTSPYRPELPGSPDASVYRSSGCGGQPDTRARMGLSVGWGDEYPWHMIEQRIEITAVPDGVYRLRAIADPFGWFDELIDTNNEFWMDLELMRDETGFPRVEIVRSSNPP